MVRQIASTFTITIKKQNEGYAIEANGSKGIRVEPQPFPQPETLLSDRKALASEKASAPPDVIQKLGQALYKALFIPPIATAWGKAQGSARGDSGVRLRLRIEPPEFASLPWETLYDGQNWLSTQSSTPLVRQLILDADSKTLQNLQVRGALHILFVGASPEGLPKLKIQETATELEKLLEEPIKKKLIEFKVLLNANLDELQLELKKDYHILYFAGHGSPEGIYLDDGQGDDIKEGDKVVGREPGDKKLVSVETLAKDLKGKQTRLVFLAACETSKAPDASPLLEGFAQELAKQSKLPAIVAMQYYISDMQANTLTTHFFVGLAAGRPVDVALAEARNALISKGDVGRDVFAPVLYLQAEDGVLFQKPKNWPAISLSVALVIAMIVGGAIARINEINEIKGFMESAEGHLTSNRTLEARIDSLRAGKNLKQSFWQAIWPDAVLGNQVLGRLIETNYGGQELNRLEGLRARSFGVAFSPNGRLLAGTGENGNARVWDTSGKQLAELKGTPSNIKRVVFSPDSKLLATIGDDNTIYLWDTFGKRLTTLKGHGDVAFSPDSKLLVTGGDDGIPRLRNISEQQSVEFKEYQDSLTSVSFSPDGKLVAIGGRDGTISLWDLSGKQLAEFNYYRGTSMIRRVTFSPDGKILVIVYKSTQFANGEKKKMFTRGVRMWNLSSRQLVAVVLEPSIEKGLFSPDGKLVATQGHNTISLLDLSGKLLKDLLNDNKNQLTGMAFNPDSQLMAISDVNGTVRLWSTSGKQWNSNGRLSEQLAELKGHQSSVYSLVFSPDGKILVTGSVDGTIRLWDLSGLQWKLYQDGNYFKSVAFSPDGKRLATSSADDIVRLWDKSGKQLTALSVEDVKGYVVSMVFTPDGKFLVIADEGGNQTKFRLWDISDKSRKQLAELKGYQENNRKFRHIISWAFSPDGKLLATGEEKGRIRLWDTSGKQLTELKTHESDDENDIIIRSIRSMAFSPDSKILATGSVDGSIHLWKLFNKQLLTTYKNNRQMVESLTFSPNGKLLAIGRTDYTASLWNWSDKRLTPLKGHTYKVYNLVFSPDGKLLATNDGNHIFLWDSSSANLLAKIQGNNGVAFSPDGKLLLTGGYSSSPLLWQVGGLDELLSMNCDWVRGYLKNNPNVDKRDRHLCDGIASRK